MPRPQAAAEREIEVEVAKEEGEAGLGQPAAFTLKGQRHAVSEVIDTWRDESYGGGYRRDAWLGHERVFFRIRTEDGAVYDVYFDMGGRRRRGKARWVLHRQVSPATPVEPASAPPASEEDATAAP